MFGYLVEIIESYFYFVYIFVIAGFLIGYIIGVLLHEQWIKKEMEYISAIEKLIIQYILISSIPELLGKEEIEPRNKLHKALGKSKIEKFKDKPYLHRSIETVFLNKDYYNYFNKYLDNVIVSQNMLDTPKHTRVSMRHYRHYYKKHQAEIDDYLELWIEEVTTGHCPYCRHPVFYGEINCHKCTMHLPPRYFFCTDKYMEIDSDVKNIYENIKYNHPDSNFLPNVYSVAFNELWFNVMVKHKLDRKYIEYPIWALNRLLEVWKKDIYKRALIDFQYCIEKSVTNKDELHSLLNQHDRLDKYADIYRERISNRNVSHNLSENNDLCEDLKEKIKQIKLTDNDLPEHVELILKTILQSIQYLYDSPSHSPTIINRMNEIENSNDIDKYWQKAQLCATSIWLWDITYEYVSEICKNIE